MAEQRNKHNMRLKSTLFTLTLGVAILFFSYILLFQISNLSEIINPPEEATGKSGENFSYEIAPINPRKDRLYNLINSYRLQNNLPALRVSAQLELSACAKDEDMISKDYWSHDSPQGVTPWHFYDLAGYAYDIAGENLAYGNYDSEERILKLWVDSPTHKENLDKDFTEQGLCIKYSENYQGSPNYVIVHHFATPQ